MRAQVHSARGEESALHCRCPLQILSYVQGIMCGHGRQAPSFLLPPGMGKMSPGWAAADPSINNGPDGDCLSHERNQRGFSHFGLIFV